MERSGYWGDGKIRTIDDLRLEIENENARDGEGLGDEDDVNARADEDSDEDMISAQVFRGKRKGKAAAESTDAGGVSAAELKEIIEQQKREIERLTQKCKRYEEEKEQIVASFQSSTSLLLERLKDLESQQTLGHERPQTACVLNNICKYLEPIAYQRWSNFFSTSVQTRIKSLNLEVESAKSPP